MALDLCDAVMIYSGCVRLVTAMHCDAPARRLFKVLRRQGLHMHFFSLHRDMF